LRYLRWIFFKNKRIVVVGGGDSALEEGLFLTRFASEVTIIHRRESLRAGAILQKRARENPKIKFIWSTTVTEVIGKERVEAVRLKDQPTGLESIHPTEGLFVFVGNTPNTQMFFGQLEMEMVSSPWMIICVPQFWCIRCEKRRSTLQASHHFSRDGVPRD
jgi:thioredoxin reductase (NADPH)